MEGIDLDPASCPKANEVVRAHQIYTIEKDGLEQEWFGSVYLNPPYGTTEEKPAWSSAEISFGRYSKKEIWTEKLLLELESGRVDQAVLVITASTGDAWFHRLVVPSADSMCFPRRIPFRRTGQTRHNGQPGASVVAYYGRYSWRFAVELGTLGWVCYEWIPRIEA